MITKNENFNQILFTKTFFHYFLIKKQQNNNLVYLCIKNFKQKLKIILLKKFQSINSNNLNLLKTSQYYYKNYFLFFFAYIFFLNKQITKQFFTFINYFLLKLCPNFLKLLLIINTITFILLNNKLFCFAAANNDAARLFEDLLTDYNKLVRPVDNNNDTLVVNFKLKLSQLLDVV